MYGVQSKPKIVRLALWDVLRFPVAERASVILDTVPVEGVRKQLAVIGRVDAKAFPPFAYLFSTSDSISFCFLNQ